MKKRSFIGIGLLVIMGCKSLTPVATTNAIDTRLRPRAVQQQIEENALRFDRLQWRGQASLEREGKRQKVSVTLRLKHGEGIWVSGSVIVPLARVFITPKQLQFYEKINRQYTQLDFRQVKTLLGAPVDYEMIERIITAGPLDKRALKRAKLTFTQNSYILSSRKRGVSLKWTYDAAFRLISQEFSDGETSVRVNYDGYTRIDNQWVPQQLMARLSGVDKTTVLRLQSKQTQLNANFKMPFEIPKGYSKIKL
jgi:YD repeat-containing protein